MRWFRGRVAFGLGALILLSGCETSTKLGDFFHKSDDAATSSLASTAPAADPDTTGSIDNDKITPADTALLGSDPSDDLALGKKQYRAGNFGLAERYFRRAVETHPRDAEAWVGLAAAYDRLRRFDLADRAYDQAVAIIGPTAGAPQQPRLFLHAARRLPACPHHALGGGRQGPEKPLCEEQSRALG